MLEKTLFLNALFSFFSSIVILVANKWLAQHIPLPGWLWITIGMGLLGFAVFLALMVKSRHLLLANALSIVLSDIAWVVISTIAVIFFASKLTLTGTVLVLMVNLVVGSFAFIQYIGYQKLILNPH